MTSDKCYENTPRAARAASSRTIRSAASDPYSSSKACAELVTTAYRRSYFAAPGAARVATARAGNVIGGGDRGEDRLLPDAVRAVEAGTPLRVRNAARGAALAARAEPSRRLSRCSRRPCTAATATRGRSGTSARAPRTSTTVGWIVERLAELWQGELSWELDEAAHPPEAAHLLLDSGAAEARARLASGRAGSSRRSSAPSNGTAASAPATTCARARSSRSTPSRRRWTVEPRRARDRHASRVSPASRARPPAVAAELRGRTRPSLGAMSPAALRTLPSRAPARARLRRAAERACSRSSLRAPARAGAPASTAPISEACYATAWQGLYGALDGGQTIANPAGLAGARHVSPGARGAGRRRACGGRGRARPGAPGRGPRRCARPRERARRPPRAAPAARGDAPPARRRASARPRRSATCRATRAPRPPRQMGISEIRMRKLMEGRARGAAGCLGEGRRARRGRSARARCVRRAGVADARARVRDARPRAASAT